MYTDTNHLQIKYSLSFYLINDLTNLILKYFSFVKEIKNIKPRKLNSFKNTTFKNLEKTVDNGIKIYKNIKSMLIINNIKINTYHIQDDNQYGPNIHVYYSKHEIFILNDIFKFYNNITEIYYMKEEFDIGDDSRFLTMIGKAHNVVDSNKIFYFYYKFFIPFKSIMFYTRPEHYIKISYNLDTLINQIILEKDKDKFIEYQSKIN